MLAAKKKRKDSTWVKQYIRDRHRYDAHSTLLPEMKASDMSRYVQCFRMDVGKFSVPKTQLYTFSGVKASFSMAFFT